MAMKVRIEKRLDGFYYPTMQLVMGKTETWIILFIRSTDKPLRFGTETGAGKIIKKWVAAGCEEDLMVTEKIITETRVTV